MAQNIRTVDYYYTNCDNKPGVGAKLLNVFKNAGVNFLAIHAFPNNRKTQVDLVPENSSAFLKVARTQKLKLGKKKKAFFAVGDDHVGVIADILEVLGERKINVTAITALAASQKQFGAIFWVKPKDQKKAATALGVK